MVLLLVALHCCSGAASGVEELLGGGGEVLQDSGVAGSLGGLVEVAVRGVGSKVVVVRGALVSDAIGGRRGVEVALGSAGDRDGGSNLSVMRSGDGGSRSRSSGDGGGHRRGSSDPVRGGSSGF